MKTCPVCNAVAFEDALTCFGCLYDYGEQQAPPDCDALGEVALSADVQQDEERAPRQGEGPAAACSLHVDRDPAAPCAPQDESGSPAAIAAEIARDPALACDAQTVQSSTAAHVSQSGQPLEESQSPQLEATSCVEQVAQQEDPPLDEGAKPPAFERSVAPEQRVGPKHAIGSQKEVFSPAFLIKLVPREDAGSLSWSCAVELAAG